MTIQKTLLAVLALLSLSVLIYKPASKAQSDRAKPRGHVRKNGVDLDIRSQGRAKADQIAQSGMRVPAIQANSAPNLPLVPQVKLRRGNVQANDGSLDNIQSFPPQIPFFNFTQSETSLAAKGRNIVATYNTTAFTSLVEIGGQLFIDHEFLSGFSNSTDGGRTWKTGFMPPIPGSIATLGDPAVDVDRHGNFHFAGLGLDDQFRVTIQVNKSTDGGSSWSDAVVVQQDDGGDKEWIAVGPDPVQRNRDNVYVTWTSFQPNSAELRLGRSTDGGATWTTKTIFTPGPDPNPDNPQQFLQFTAPYVDAVTGTLYIPFLRFSFGNVDFIQMLISNDAGEHFSFATFNVAGAPDPTLLPLVQPGTICDCGVFGGVRLVMKEGPDVGGRFGLPRFVNASRVLSQPALAARNGVVYLAYSTSTSPVSGDPNGRSNIMFIRSSDGGATWTTPIQANPDVGSEIHHLMPSLAIDSDPNDVHIGYYTQQGDETIDLDLANSHDSGGSFPANRTARVTSNSFALPPTNIPLSADITYNYDNLIVPCYALGEYISVKSANGAVYALWGDDRNTVTHPSNPFDPLSGVTHPQEDVFFQYIKAQ
jgi:hypothetical protein